MMTTLEEALQELERAKKAVAELQIARDSAALAVDLAKQTAQSAERQKRYVCCTFIYCNARSGGRS